MNDELNHLHNSTFGRRVPSADPERHTAELELGGPMQIF